MNKTAAIAAGLIVVAAGAISFARRPTSLRHCVLVFVPGTQPAGLPTKRPSAYDVFVPGGVGLPPGASVAECHDEGVCLDGCDALRWWDLADGGTP